jgi:hypothetical protein
MLRNIYRFAFPTTAEARTGIHCEAGDLKPSSQELHGKKRLVPKQQMHPVGNLLRKTAGTQ